VVVRSPFKAWFLPWILKRAMRYLL